MKNKIINIINFVRGCEPRYPEIDLVATTKNEMELNKKYGFPNTLLIQYDAMINKEFQKVFRDEKDENTEIGIWFECVRELVEACGLEWRGAADLTWDWHIIPGFLMAYTQPERCLMIDEFMNKFHKIFGYYPKSVGSWLLDSFSIRYMQEKYNIRAFVMCREQYGVDAYTVWGGYYNQGYYPAKNNMMCPAQTAENAVKAPIFKMLGIDPIYGYDEEEFDTGGNHGCVATMEPAGGYGSDMHIMRSYLNSYFKEECMSFAYTTVGQENSFGWDSFGNTLDKQLEMIDSMQKNNEVTVEKLCDTGDWFIKTFDKNPSVALISYDDWADNGLKSIWFNCENYRANLFLDKKKLYFRDIMKFDEHYDERYLNEACATMTAYYDNLPVVDGRLWNGNNIKSGLKFDAEVSEISVQKEGEILVCRCDSRQGEIKISFSNYCISIEKPEEVNIYFERGSEINSSVFKTQIEPDGNAVKFKHNGFLYQITCNTTIKSTEKGYETGKGERNVKISFA